MKLLKLILFIFAIYFVRRFIQMYKVMKQIQENQMRAAQNSQEQKPKPAAQQGPQVVDVEYRVIDN